MFRLLNFRQKKADRLHDQGQALHDEGREDEAIAKYQQAIQHDPHKSESYYNIGLIYKYRNDWAKSFEYNKKAYELAPEDEAARWNLAIAATALRDWQTARQVWRDNGLEVYEGDGPINADFGLTPVRLNPDGEAEVVWAERIDPVRARILSVPLPGSGYGAGDIVLHDGAAVGYRKIGDSERPVFNVLEMYEPSQLKTYKIEVKVARQADVEVLERMLEQRDMIAEDWTINYRVLCKACSEGRPHDEHDADGDKTWTPKHQVAVGALSQNDIDTVLQQWQCEPNRLVIGVNCLFARD